MTRFLLVCLGGALGSGIRYLIGAALPYGTLLVNLLGSMLIAIALESMRPTEVRLMLTAGFLGGFTTYSTFNEETLHLMRAGAWGMAAANVLATVVGCLAAGMLGFWLARALR